MCGLIVLGALWLFAGVGVAAAATVQEQGYIPTCDTIVNQPCRRNLALSHPGR
jgi:hypothetical protein